MLTTLHVQSVQQEYSVTKPISPLRQRMIDDMKFRNMSPSNQKVYIYAVANFSAFHGRPPDKRGIEHVRACRIHLMSRGLKAASINPIIGGLRFFYGITLGQKEMAEQIPFARKEDRLPVVLTPDEVAKLLKAESNLEMRTAWSRSMPPDCASPRSSHLPSRTLIAPGWLSTFARPKDAKTAM
jgi:hypothetical protein